MNKAELVDEIHKLLDGAPARAAVERSLDAVLEAVRRGIKRDGEVQLVGFGVFRVVERKARRGWNPQTKRHMKIKGARMVRFRAGTELRKVV